MKLCLGTCQCLLRVEAGSEMALSLYQIAFLVLQDSCRAAEMKVIFLKLRAESSRRSLRMRQSIPYRKETSLFGDEMTLIACCLMDPFRNEIEPGFDQLV